MLFIQLVIIWLFAIIALTLAFIYAISISCAGTRITKPNLGVLSGM